MGLTAFIAAYRAAATQLAGRAYARQWHEMGLAPQDAATWANLGYTPAESAASGLTLDQARIAGLPRDAAGIWRDGKRIA